MRKKIVIFGIKDLAELAYYYIQEDTDYEVDCFVVSREFFKERYFTPRGYEKVEVKIWEEVLEEYGPSEYLLFAPMTGVKMNCIRKSIFDQGKSKGFDFFSYVSSKATILSQNIGENCFILENNTVQPFVRIGDNVMMWSGNHIGHDSIIESHCFITSHVVISGHCRIQECSWIGVNATLRDGLSIGKGTLIAMAAVITKDTEPDGLYMGAPAIKKSIPASKAY